LRKPSQRISNGIRPSATEQEPIRLFLGIVLTAAFVAAVTDPEGDAITITIDSIFNDESADARGSGETSPDGREVGTTVVEMRAERVGDANGRIYRISLTADDA
jgi:hypothetical protein